jgi:hypothetical protein
MALTDKLSAIGNAIREKNGTTDLIPLADMPQAILDIQSGGGDSDLTEIETIIDESGVLDSTEGTVEEKVEKLVDYANFKNIIQEALYNLEGSSAYNQLSTFNNTSIEDVSMFDFSKVKYFNSAFGGTKIKELDIDLSSAISLNNFISNSKEIKKVIFRNMTTTLTGMYGAFNYCRNLEYIATLNVGGVTDKVYGVGNAFDNNVALKEIRFVENCIKVPISFAHSSLLTTESIQSIIDGLATVETAQTLTLHADVKAKLTDTQLATITGKNWSVA